MKGTIIMSNKEINQVDIFEKLVRKEIKQKKAALMLGLSVRQIKRKLAVYKIKGTQSLIHQGRRKIGNRKISLEITDVLMNIIREKYWDFGPTLAHEKLVENYECKLSLATIRKEMIAANLWKSSGRRKAHVHQLRERRACVGELLQLDGSPHDWFEGRAPKCNLNVIIDDATSSVSLKLSKSETTQDYCELIEEYVLEFGLPLAIYADKHSIFRVNTTTNFDLKKPDKNNQFEGLTQFGRAMKELNIELIFANTPQAKGRVERVNQTLQDRLVKELRLNNISDIKDANIFLKIFTKRFNMRFSVKPKSIVDMHRKLNRDINLKKILCVKEKRVLSKNLTFQYNDTIYQIKTQRSAYTLRKTIITICERYEGVITIWDTKNNQFEYTTIKKLPSTRETNSKKLNQLVDAILVRENYKKKNPWESDFEELEQQNLFFKPVGAI
jgi:transposase